MSGKIVRKKNSPIIAILILAIGIALLVMMRYLKMSDSLMTTCLTLGFITTAVGFILTAMTFSGALTHYIYLPTKSPMKDKKVYLSTDEYNGIVSLIESGNIHSLTTLNTVVSSNCALRILASRDGACLLVQAGRFDSNNFEPETQVLQITSADSTAIQALCK